MASAWIPVVAAGIGGVIGAGSALLAGRIDASRRRREAERQRRRQRLEEYQASVVGALDHCTMYAVHAQPNGYPGLSEDARGAAVAAEHEAALASVFNVTMMASRLDDPDLRGTCSDAARSLRTTLDRFELALGRDEALGTSYGDAWQAYVTARDSLERTLEAVSAELRTPS
jgi:hypothetical protein